jgi:hypothetical protein
VPTYVDCSFRKQAGYVTSECIICKFPRDIVKLDRADRWFSFSHEPAKVDVFWVAAFNRMQKDLADCRARLNCDRHFAYIRKFQRQASGESWAGVYASTWRLRSAVG